MSIEIPQGIDLHRLDRGAPLTPLDKRAIRTAWTPALAQALITPGAFASALMFARVAPPVSTAALIAAALMSLAALALLPAQARGCRKVSAYRIVCTDLYAVSGITPYEYRQWVASLPEPGRAWRALGAPTPQRRPADPARVPSPHMSRRRPVLLVVSLAAILAGGCGSSTSISTHASQPGANGSGTTAARSTSTTTATRRSTPRLTPPAVAAAFAGAYARYLDGLLPAAALPASTPTARAQAGPLIPPADRAGALVAQPLQPLSGGQTFAAQLRDRAHTFAVQLTVGRVGSRWLIVGLQAPDLDSILHTQNRPIPQPSGSAAAARAARAFIAGYLPWLYGQGQVSAIHDATAGLIGQLKAYPPNIPPSLQGLHPRLAALGMQRRAPGWQALANVTDGRQTYDLTLTVVRDHGRWLVSDVSYPH